MGGAAHDISASLWLMLLPKDGWEIRGFAHVSTACAHSRRHLSARRCHRPKPSRTSWGAASFSRSVRQIFHSVQLDFLWIFYLWKDQTKSSLKVRIIYATYRRNFFSSFSRSVFLTYDSASVWLRHLACSPKNSWQNTWVFQWKLEKVFSTDKLRHHASNLAAKEFESDLEYLICHSPLTIWHRLLQDMYFKRCAKIRQIPC